MITRLSHCSFFVLDQDSAKDFYVNKLGFEVRLYAPIGDKGHWLTVAPKDQPELEISLIPVDNGIMFGPDIAARLADLIREGSFGFGVFECTDIYATYEELKSKGVEFTKEPTKVVYGIEAMFKDDSGNWFALVQKKEGYK